MRHCRKKPRRITIERATKIYWNLHGDKKPSRKSYRTYIRYICQFFHGRLIDTISYIDVANYREWRKKKVCPATVNREHTVITHLFYQLRKWVDMKIIDPVTLPKANPGSLVKKEPETARKRILSQNEVKRLLDASSLELQRVILAAMHTLLRRKDLRLLTRKNINQMTGCIEGIQAKTGRPYSIPINAILGKILESAKGSSIFDFINFRKDFEEAREKAGLPDVQFRDLRRTGARRILKGGFDIATVSSYLGHASIRMTQNYVQPEKTDLIKAAEFLENEGWDF